MIIENSSLDEWVETLKPYQKSTIKALSEQHGEEETAKKWLSAQGPSSTIGFGGISNPEPFFDRFMEEFRKFICGDEAYDSFRKQLGAESPVVKTIYVSVISTALGAALGYTATLLAPAVAVMLHLVGKMGSTHGVPQANNGRQADPFSTAHRSVTNGRLLPALTASRFRDHVITGRWKTISTVMAGYRWIWI